MIPININIVSEDDLSETVLKVILEQINKHFVVHQCFPDLNRESSSRGFGYIKKRIKGFNQAAKGMPFLVLTDLDIGSCAPDLIKEWLPFPKHPNLIFRVAVREVEAWVLADRKSFANFLGIDQKIIPFDVDNQLDDPKKFLIRAARRSRKKNIKSALIPRPDSTALIGPDYNGTLMNFVRNRWRMNEAIKHSDSLRRTYHALKNFQPKSKY